MKRHYTPCTPRRSWPAPVVLSALLLFLGLTVLPAQPDTPAKKRIDPAGIEGALILSGADIPTAALERFVALAGGKEKKARVVVIHYIPEGKPPAGEISPVKAFKGEPFKEKIESFTTIALAPQQKLKDEELETLKKATGVWLTGIDPEKAVPLSLSAAEIKECANALKRGGVVAGSGFTALQFGEQYAHPFSANGMYGGLRFLPDSLVGPAAKPGDKLTVAKLMTFNPGRVGYEIEPDAALLVRGRKLSALGDGKITIYLAGCSFKPAREIVLQGKKGLADLTALRQEALGRTQPKSGPRLIKNR